ncbi:MAG: hypothetical protein FWG65_12385 [Turicibacter sp.]|nr:hypothetical protein [Turicibacter sp.]
MEYFEISVTRRHSDILTALFGKLFILFEDRHYLRKEDRDLVYAGDFREGTAELIDITKIADIDHFRKSTILELRTVKRVSAQNPCQTCLCPKNYTQKVGLSWIYLI